MATVERSGFQKLFRKVLPDVQMPSRRTLGRQIEDLHQLHKADLIAELTNVTYLSVAADLWSSHKRGFLGITVHYIDPERLERVSHVLACRRFKGSHTGQQIAAVMTGIFEEFEITSKVTACITDNAANMAKAVRLLEAACSESIDTDGVDAAVSTDDAGVEAVPIHDLLAEEASRDDDLKMIAKQVRCANHTLNLVAAVDSRAARSDDKFKRAYDNAMAKVQALSNAVNKSVKHADVVEEVAGIAFLNPTCTRWSSEFNAVTRIVNVGLEKVRECQLKIGLVPLTESNMSFLKGFVQVMKPLAVAMDFLQGETECFVGQVIPTVMGVQAKLSSMVIDSTMKPLADALLAGLQNRFRAIFADDQYHLASMLIPEFKLNYLPENERHTKKLLLAHAVSAVVNDQITSSTTCTATSIQPQQVTGVPDDDDLFQFIKYNTSTESAQRGQTIDQEIETYVNSSETRTTLILQFPHLLKAFLKYNAALPSGAAVERLFSCAGQILVPRRCKVSDDMFEKFVFLRYKLK